MNNKFEGENEINFNKDEDNNEIKLNELYNKSLREHSHFLYDFDSQKFHFSKIIHAFLLYNHYFNNNYFPITTNIKYKDGNFEIERIRIYNDFYNYSGQSDQIIYGRLKSSEKIIINKKTGLISLNDDAFKKEGVLISLDSIMSKSVKFKIYGSAKQLLFFQNIYYFNSLSGINNYNNLMMNSFNNKINFNDIGNLEYHQVIKNIL